MRTRRRMRGAGPLGAGLLVAVLLLGWIPNSGAQTFGVGDPVELRGFAHGINAHVTGIRTGETNVVDVGAATSSAVVDADADGVGGRKVNEVNRSLQPEVGNKFSYARGIGLEAGLGVTPDTEDQLQLAGLAEQSAPPDNDEPVTEEIAADLSPLAYASLVRGQALANAQDNGLIPEVCVLGDDLSRGIGYAEDVEAVELGGTDEPGLESPLVAIDDAQEPDNGIESKSFTRLVPTGTPNNFGLLSETRQNILPVSLLQTEVGEADPRLLTLEVAGTWFLRTVATGKAGGAEVLFGSTQGSVTKENVTDLLSLLDGGGNDILDPLPVDELEDILGPDGLEIPGDPIINISIAQKERKLVGPDEFPDPEAPAEEAANGTKAEGAVDVVRIRLLAPATDTMIADIRLGHMEGSTQVPAGGVNCPIPVTKTADPRSINLGSTGNESKITLTVHNDFDCDLTGVVLTDRIRQLEGDPDFKLTEASPAPKSPTIPTGNISTADVVWELGDIKKGEEKSVTMTLQAATKGGIIRDIAEATGKLANCAGEDVAGLAIAGLNLSGLSNPVDIAIPLAVTGVAGGIPTAATGAALSAAALGLAGFLRRRRRP